MKLIIYQTEILYFPTHHVHDWIVTIKSFLLTRDLRNAFPDPAGCHHLSGKLIGNKQEV